MLSVIRHVLVLSVVAALASGCASVKRATGQLDDSVLPGQRENVLPPEQQTARDPNVTGKQNAGTMSDDSIQSEQSNCQPDEPNCIPQQGSSDIQ